MERKLLDILVCPATREPLAMLDVASLKALNTAVAGGTVQRTDGTLQRDALGEALVTRDRRRVYRADDGIPVLLVGEGIATAAIPGFAQA